MLFPRDSLSLFHQQSAESLQSVMSDVGKNGRDNIPGAGIWLGLVHARVLQSRTHVTRELCCSRLSPS